MLRKILIVDDAKTNRIMLRSILQRDYDIYEAENGEEALVMLHRYFKVLSAMVLDLCMPVMDGYGVLRAMRDNVALSQIPVLVVTGSDEDDVRVKALSLGANDFVTKPYNPEVIRHSLHNSINMRETASIINAIQTDKLTGLYCREAFFEKVWGTVGTEKPGSFVMTCFDIDNFKLINDRFGAVEGDKILKHIGAEMKKAFLDVGGICGRISGDNFAGVYPNTKRAELIITESRERFVPANTHYTVTFSVGRYVISDLDLSVSAMYDRAYIAKQSVKGMYDRHVAYFDETMLEKLMRERLVIGEMTGALAKNQFEVWFQPQMNHSTGALIGAEALVRWRHPERGLISPGLFIPIFEQNGFIYELDKYVWEQTCVYLRKWLDEGRNPMPVSVNISRYDIFKDDLIEVINGLIDRYRLPIDLLRLEITESAFASSSKQIISVVKHLMNSGYTVEIDDFGSGYSSLNTLKDVPADILKLDMKFLENDGDSQRGGNIVESVVRMAKWLGMSVLAEGVEDKAQADFLESVGCCYIQGYLYAKPMPAAEYELYAKNVGKEEKMLALETVENLDNNAFWDPKSMDTLIFNSYVGAACIFEYNNGNIELLRSTEKFASLLGSGSMTVDDVLKLEWMSCLEPKSRETVRAGLARSAKTGEEFTEEYVFDNLPGCAKATYLRSTMRVIATAGARHLVYCTSENITAQRIAERKVIESSKRLQAIMQNVNCGITAVIIGKQPRVLFANDKYYSILGYTKEQFEDEVKDVYQTLFREDRAQTLKKINAAVSTGESISEELRAVRRDGTVVWLGVRISLTHFPEIDEPVQLASYTDISAEKKARQEIHDTDERLRFLNDTAHSLLSREDVCEGIEETLRKLLEYFAGTRAFIFEYDATNSVYLNAYEVCAEGASALNDDYGVVSADRMKFWTEKFSRRHNIHIRNSEAVGKLYPEEAKSLIQRGVKSLIAVSLRRDGRFIGFVGIDNPGRNDSKMSRLDAIGDYLAVMLMRRDLTQRIENDAAAAVSLMNDTPGGFARMKVCTDGRITPVLLNDGFYKLLGVTRGSLSDDYTRDGFSAIHPEDEEKVRLSVERLLRDGEAHSDRYRLRRANGEYIWVMFFGRAVKDESGDTYLNVYYSDMTEQEKAEEQQRRLLDNLPCGTALFEYDGKRLEIVHLNRRYKQMAERNPNMSLSVSAYDSIHPDDRRVVEMEIQAAIRQNRDGACDVRVKGDDGCYRPFHVSASFLYRDEKSYFVCTAYTPISEGAMSVQEVLPVALNAMMSSSTDFSFVKDRDLHYICCSRSTAKLVGLASERDIIGKTDYDIFPKELADKYVADDRGVMNGGNPIINAIEKIPGENGETRYANTSKYVLKDSAGNAIGMYGFSRDVTMTLEDETRLKLLTDSVPGGIARYEVTNTTPAEGKLTYFSDGFSRLFGFSREEYIRQSAINPLSLVLVEDLPKLREQINDFLRGGKPLDCVYRARTSGPAVKWVNLKAVIGERREDRNIVNTVIFDVTDRQSAMERLKISEETNRLAMKQTGHKICRYTVADRSLILPETNPIFSLGRKVENVPYDPVRRGEISADTSDAYIKFYESILKGKEEGSVIFRRASAEGWRWVEAHFTTIFSADEKPVSAVLSYTDVTDKQNKEAVFRKWQQSLTDANPETYTLFRCNLSKDTTLDSVEGGLLAVKFDASEETFDERTAEYVAQFVYEGDSERYTAALRADTLMANYYRGKRSGSLEYREKTNNGVRWLRLNYDMVEYPNSKDIEIYLMYRNIDEGKKAELEAIERAETDALTGILNRSAFVLQMDAAIRKFSPNAVHALLMLDIDGFKQVNDAFGHDTGDKVLTDTAHKIRTLMRKDDLLGRLGGDEFVVFLANIKDDSVAANTAQDIVNATLRSLSAEVKVSSSVGIAICGRDGKSFSTLYKKADLALYHVKGSGRNDYAFYRDDLDGENMAVEKPEQPGKALKRRMLIVDDSSIDFELMKSVFEDSFIVDKASDGAQALIRLRHFGSAVSVVLLDLLMPGMDGFTVLQRMKESREMQSIPVVVVSSDDETETGLKAISEGASDFVTKPFDAELLRVRVFSAVSRSENDRLRLQNSYLRVKNDDLNMYRMVLRRAGIAVIENDWIHGTFTYDPNVSAYLAGIYDGRKLWRILLSDMVADTVTVQKMQSTLRCVADDRECTEKTVYVRLKTPSRIKHWFRMTAFKIANEFRLTEKFVIMLEDAGLEPPDGEEK